MGTSRKLVVIAAAFAVAAGLAPSPASANLADIIPGLFAEDIFLSPPPPGQPSHATHFVDSGQGLEITARSLTGALSTQLSSFPIASAAGGFTYEFDPEAGVLVRSTDSFGPVFVERASTIGKGKWSFGFNVQQASYDTIDDIGLDNGAIEFQLVHEDTDRSGNSITLFFEGDIINVNTFIEVDTTTTVLFANWGVSDNFDLSIAVPIIDVELGAVAVLTVDPLASGAVPIHRFENGSTQETFAASDSATGVGDILLRSKLRLVDGEKGDFAMGLDLRLPTGDEDDLLGTGATQAKLYLMGSGSWGKVSPHVNLGYTYSDGGSNLVRDVPDELSYSLALDIAAHPRLTIVGEVLGRTLLDATRLDRQQLTFQHTTISDRTTVLTATRPVVQLVEDDIELWLGAFGLKFNPGGNVLITADAVVSLGDDGLQDDDVIYVLGLDISL